MDVAGSERVPPSPLGWFWVQLTQNYIVINVYFRAHSFFGFQSTRNIAVKAIFHTFDANTYLFQAPQGRGEPPGYVNGDDIINDWGITVHFLSVTMISVSKVVYRKIFQSYDEEQKKIGSIFNIPGREHMIT